MFGSDLVVKELHIRELNLTIGFMSVRRMGTTWKEVFIAAVVLQ
jgi:hypothetical protein